MTEYALEDALELELLDEGFNNAVEAATEANRAGLDHQEQLEHGIKAYVYTLLWLGILVPKETT